ncbi:DUF935 family protein [Pseudomonas sp. Pf153]|uniref:phage portal protein family protein n=1 Tax=Pseudomonas sp. Pf153 TaxID=1699309 RepID=UPI0021086DC8|nr:DUF935 family protein [Pseudomonas sp. Pf153]
MVRVQSRLPNKIRSAGRCEGESERVPLFLCLRKRSQTKGFVHTRHPRRRAAIVTTALNACIGHVVDLNFGPQVIAPRYALWQQEEIDKSLAQRDKALTASGVKFTNAYWQRTYNLQDDDLQQAQTQSEKPAFAGATQHPAPDQTALDQAIHNLPTEHLNQLTENLANLMFMADTWGRLSTSSDRED